MKLERSTIPLVSAVRYDPVTALAIEPFDLSMEETTQFYQYLVPSLPMNYNIGLIVGSSGSGKSLLLNRMGTQETFVYFPDRAIASYFLTPEIAREKLYAVGLNSIPKWKLPYQSLSTGEKHRFDIAARLTHNSVIDEFTSVVDRNVARSLSTAVSRYIRKHDVKGVVFASCHRDIVPFLKPDWIIDTDAGEYIDVDPEENVGRWWSEFIKGDYAVGTIHYS